MAVVVQIDGFDPVAGAAVTLRAASHDDASVCHLNGVTWWPALAKLPTLRYDLFDGAFAGQITAPSSSLAVQVEPWPDFGRYALADARLRLWTGEPGDPWASWSMRFDGRVKEQPEIADGQVQVNFAVDDRWLDQPLLATYAGTTGAEGPAALKGQVKPLALGAPRYVEGVLIDVPNNVFQVSGYGAVQGFEAALERLLRFGAATADYPTYAALVAASVPAGRWATCKAQGLARLGAPPTGQISFLLQGDAASPNGWALKPGQLIRRIALLSGGTGKVDDTTLDALDVARPYNLSLYLDAQTTAREVIQDLAASVNAVAGMTWFGKLFVLPVGIGTAQVTLAADGSALPPVASVEQVAIGAPWRKVAITAERAWTVHDLGDIAFTATLTDLGAYAAAATYREGNIVQSGGSSFVYINPVATSGNAPPTAPATENSYWRALAKAGDPGAAGASAKLLVVTSNSQQLTLDAAGQLSPATGQNITFTAVKQNTGATVSWYVAGANGGNPITTGDSWTFAASDMLATMAGLGAKSLTIEGRLTDGGSTLSDKISVVSTQAGDPGTPGSPGVPGVAAWTPITSGFARTGTTFTAQTTYSNPNYSNALYSRERGPGASVAWTVDQVEAGMVVSLNSDPEATTGYQGQDYTLYLSASPDTGGQVRALASGTDLGQVATYAAGDNFRMTHRGTSVQCFKNGAATPIATFQGVPATAALALDIRARTAGKSLSNVTLSFAGDKGDQGPAGISAPQPANISRGQDTITLRVNAGQSISATLEAELTAPTQRTATLQIQVTPQGGATNVIASGSLFVGPGEPAYFSLSGTWTNNIGANVFVDVKAVPSNGSFSTAGSNYLGVG